MDDDELPDEVLDDEEDAEERKKSEQRFLAFLAARSERVEIADPEAAVRALPEEDAEGDDE
jgi:hypothetical protein